MKFFLGDLGPNYLRVVIILFPLRCTFSHSMFTLHQGASFGANPAYAESSSTLYEPTRKEILLRLSKRRMDFFILCWVNAKWLKLENICKIKRERRTNTWNRTLIVLLRLRSFFLIMPFYTVFGGKNNNINTLEK